jgi:hypothetical protein
MNNANSPSFVPFVCQFAHSLPEVPVRDFRYDDKRQVGQMLINDCWVDTPDAKGNSHARTRITKVNMETTDDE